VPPISRHIGRYQVVQHLERDDVADTYLCMRAGLADGESVHVVKALRSERVPRGPAALRFMEEARRLAQLSHPNLPQVIEVADAGGVMFVAMELVDGPALNSVLAALEGHRQDDDCYRFARVFQGISGALGAAHGKELDKALAAGTFRTARALCPELPPALDDLIVRCLRTDPAARPSAIELTALLAAMVATGTPPIDVGAFAAWLASLPIVAEHGWTRLDRGTPTAGTPGTRSPLAIRGVAEPIPVDRPTVWALASVGMTVLAVVLVAAWLLWPAPPAPAGEAARTAPAQPTRAAPQTPAPTPAPNATAAPLPEAGSADGERGEADPPATTGNGDAASASAVVPAPAPVSIPVPVPVPVPAPVAEPAASPRPVLVPSPSGRNGELKDPWED
jgi:hypothetical protein